MNWVKTSERFPEEGQKVLFILFDQEKIGMFETKRFYSEDIFGYVSPKHVRCWRPLDEIELPEDLR